MIIILILKTKLMAESFAFYFASTRKETENPVLIGDGFFVNEMDEKVVLSGLSQQILGCHSV